MSTQALSPFVPIAVTQTFFETEAVELTQRMLGFCKRKMDWLDEKPESFEALSIRDLRVLAKMLHDLLKDLATFASMVMDGIKPAAAQEAPTPKSAPSQHKSLFQQAKTGWASSPPAPQPTSANKASIPVKNTTPEENFSEFNESGSPKTGAQEPECDETTGSLQDIWADIAEGQAAIARLEAQADAEPKGKKETAESLHNFMAEIAKAQKAIAGLDALTEAGPADEVLSSATTASNAASSFQDRFRHGKKRKKK